jgi:hypothetical protein
MHTWAHLLKQQSSIPVYHLSTKESYLQFSIAIFSKQMEVCWKMATSIRSLQKETANFHKLYVCALYIFCRFNRKTEALVIFLNPVTVCSSYK